MSKKKDPKVEWGFFAVVPRIVRTQYKELSHTEKWLYVCLKDLCGDRGTCYRTLRVLAQETDLSIGNLSTGIRKLHDAGLIHAEKKRRSINPTAKEVWHISIVDIWPSNVEYCSKFEHSTEENVQEMNNNVQIMNNPPVECSIPEQQCSNFDDRRNNTEEQQSEERTIEEESITSSDEDVRTRAELFEDVKEIHSEVKQEVKRQTDKHKAVHALSEDEPTDKMPAIKPSKQTVSQSEPAAGRGPAQGIGAASASTATPSGAQRAGDQSAQGGAKAAVIPKRPRGKKPITMEDELPKEPPQMPLAEMAWGTRKCLLKFDARRGATLIGKWKNSQASECAKGLATQFDEAYVAAAVEVMEEDSYYADRFVDVCDVANNIHKYRKKIERKMGVTSPPTEKGEDHSDFDIYEGNGPEEREALYQEGLERLKNGTLI